MLIDSFKNCSLIVATDNRGVIAKAGEIPWYSSKDFKWFKMHTVGKGCVVGNTTFETLPKFGLSNRIVQRFGHYRTDLQDPLDWLADLSDVMIRDKRVFAREIMIIGGAKTYDYFMPVVNRIYLTTVDTFIPSTTDGEPLTLFKFPNWNQWENIYQSLEHDEKATVEHDPTIKGLNLKFNIFQRNYQ